MRMRRHTPKLADDGVDVKLLRKVADHIEKHPENYSQGVYFESDAAHEDESYDAVMRTREITGPVCNTKACAAGTGVLLSGRLSEFVRGSVIDWHNGGATVFGLYYDLADWLFAGDREEAMMPTLLRAIADGERSYRRLEAIEASGL